METRDILTTQAPTLNAGTAWPSVRTALYESRWFALAVTAQLVFSVGLCAVAERSPLVELDESYAAFLVAFCAVGFVVFTVEIFKRRIQVAREIPPGMAYRIAWQALRADYLTWDYVLPATLVFVLAPLAMSAFSAAKQAIPLVHPFSWDARLGTLFDPVSGSHPLWQVLQPVLGRPVVTNTLDYFYDRICTGLLLAPVVWAALLPPSQLRTRCLVAYVLIFLIAGNVVALAFASAGPAYFGRLVPGLPNPYSPLMAYLHSVDARTPLLALSGQEGLWTAYQRGETLFGWGMSATPSIHVAAATLAALYGFQTSKWVGMVFVIMAVCAFVASVALGWHYAIDGYAGAAVACGIWALAGLVARRTARAQSR